MRGGARPGAGRPRLDRPKERHNFIWDPEVWEYLQTTKDTDGMAATVDRAVKRSKGFREWMKRCRK